MILEDIIYKLLTSNSSSWILGEEVSKFIEESETNPKSSKKLIRRSQQDLIKEIQYWLVHNKLTRTRARFLEKYCNRCDNDLRRYLGLAWSVLFFEGIKVNTSVKEKIQLEQQTDKSKNNLRRNEFNSTLNRIKHQNKFTDKDMMDTTKLLRKFIGSNKIRTFKYYGIPKSEWVVNNVNYNFLKKEIPTH